MSHDRRRGAGQLKNLCALYSFHVVLKIYLEKLLVQETNLLGLEEFVQKYNITFE